MKDHPKMKSSNDHDEAVNDQKRAGDCIPTRSHQQNADVHGIAREAINRNHHKTHGWLPERDPCKTSGNTGNSRSARPNTGSRQWR
jgi:hypothetical protein